MKSWTTELARLPQGVSFLASAARSAGARVKITEYNGAPCVRIDTNPKKMAEVHGSLCQAQAFKWDGYTTFVWHGKKQI